MLGLSVIILIKSVLHVFCSLVFSAHNTCDTIPETPLEQTGFRCGYLPVPAAPTHWVVPKQQALNIKGLLQGV